MAVLPAAPTDVDRVAGSAEERWRQLALVAAGVAILVMLVPPLREAARRYVYAETVQFCLAAFGVPGLLVFGNPWAHLGRASKVWTALARLGDARVRHPGLARSFGFAAVDVGVIVAWRTPAAVDAMTRDGWLLAAEIVSLAVAGTGLWLELLACPPLAPRLPRPWRAVLAAACMWATWIVAYVVGFSHAPWYLALDRGGVLGAAADQQIAAGVLWLGGIFAFMPLIFSDVLAWLHGEPDPDAELRRLVQAERRAGRWGPPAGGTRGGH